MTDPERVAQRFYRTARFLPVTVSLLAIPILLQAQTLEDPRNILHERTARYAYEIDRTDPQIGAESNPTGNPIGGGAGYTNMITSGDDTIRTYEDLRMALDHATAGDVIFIPGDAVIEFTDKPALTIPANVTLASTRGRSGSEGALLFSNALDTDMMLYAHGDYIRITGLRLRGPFDLTYRVPLGSDGLEIDGFGVEVDNCTVSAFSHAGISIEDDASRTYIHHNYIFHNRRNGLGYGVSSSGSDILFEANHFHRNRHHVANGGDPGSAYEARYNLLGPGNLDMHGGRDRGDLTPIAGDWLHIHHNTKTGGSNLIGIRGVPSQGAWVHHNWMKNPERDEMIIADGNRHFYENAVGPDKTPYRLDTQ